MSLEDQLSDRFTCTKCKHHGGNTKKIATTGTGISKFFDVQHNHFVAVSCRNCGYTEMYNPDILGGKSKLGTIFDVIFER